MPSKNMLPKGKRRQSVRADYRAARDLTTVAEQQLRRESEAALFGEAPPPRPLEPKLPPAPEPPTERRTRNRRSKVLKSTSANTSQAPSSATSKTTNFLRNSPQPPTAADQHDFLVPIASRDARLDQFLAGALPHTSRSRVQLLIESGQVQINDRLEKPRYKLQPGDLIRVTGEPQPPPLRATSENIPLHIVYEDNDLAVVDKPAGMAVHAGSGATDEARSGGTLVNALLYLFKDRLSNVGGELRPGIVHRLDKETSGLILVAKNDRAHRALGEMFQGHTLTKRYLALVHKIVRNDSGTIDLPIGRDPIRRTRMTTKLSRSWITTSSHGRASLRHPEELESDEIRRKNEPREAISHYRVLERLHTAAGDFTLLEVEIETGRTHQIRVHMQALGHPVVGDTTYGAPSRIRGFDVVEDEVAGEVERGAGEGPVTMAHSAGQETVMAAAAGTEGEKVKAARSLPRNFLHAAHLSLAHPISGEPLELDAPLPVELTAFLQRLRSLAE